VSWRATHASKFALAAVLVVRLGVWLNSAAAQEAKTSSPPKKGSPAAASSIDLTKHPTLYAVGYAHLTVDGQTIRLPLGRFNRLYLLAAANGNQSAEFKVGDKPVNLNVQDWTGFVGQWDDRIWNTTEEPIPQTRGASPAGGGPQVRLNEYGQMIGIRPGVIKRADIGWFASHRHDAAGSNEPYRYSYLLHMRSMSRRVRRSSRCPETTTSAYLRQRRRIREAKPGQHNLCTMCYIQPRAEHRNDTFFMVQNHS
jgi:hypothetical protein